MRFEDRLDKAFTNNKSSLMEGYSPYDYFGHPGEGGTPIQDTDEFHERARGVYAEINSMLRDALASIDEIDLSSLSVVGDAFEVLRHVADESYDIFAVAYNEKRGTPDKYRPGASLEKHKKALTPEMFKRRYGYSPEEYEKRHGIWPEGVLTREKGQ